MQSIARLTWSSSQLPERLVVALRTLAASGYSRLVEGTATYNALKFREVPLDNGRHVCRCLRQDDCFVIEYSSLSMALRGVGCALAGLEADERCPLDRLGYMRDCSRNNVVLPSNFKTWLARTALMGYNYAILYCENTFALEDEPYFGYMRGAYTLEELKEMDDFAAALGIELVGHCEVLGHCEQFLKWRHFARLGDTPSILLIDDPDAQALLKKVISFWAKALRSRRLGIGMDEAHMMLRGAYLDRHGYTADTLAAFNRHLAFVNGLCHEHGLTPLLYADMYFTASGSRNQFSGDKIPQEIVATIPRGVELVHWDYYNADEAIYTKMLSRLKETGFPTVMMSGVWTWEGRLWYEQNRTMDCVVPAIAACRKCGVRDLNFSLWGDDGGTCDFDSALTGLARAADLACGTGDENATAQRFDAVCGGNYKASLLASKLPHVFHFNRFEGFRDLYHCSMQVQLFDDPLMGMVAENFEAAVPGQPAAFLRQLKETQRRLCHVRSQACGDFVNLNNLLRLMVDKLELRRDFVQAYDSRDTDALRLIVRKRIPAIIDAIQAYLESFTAMWLREAKPFGLEAMQIRIGGLIVRYQEMARRIKEYLNGTREDIPELEARRKFTGDDIEQFSQSPCAQTPSVWH